MFDELNTARKLQTYQGTVLSYASGSLMALPDGGSRVIVAKLIYGAIIHINGRPRCCHLRGGHQFEWQGVALESALDLAVRSGE